MAADSSLNLSVYKGATKPNFSHLHDNTKLLVKFKINTVIFGANCLQICLED